MNPEPASPRPDDPADGPSDGGVAMADAGSGDAPEDAGEGRDEAPAVAEPHGTEPHGTEGFLRAILRILEDGPLTAYGLTLEFERRWPGYLDGRQGFVHSALLQLRRRGDIGAERVRLPVGHRRVFRLGGERGSDTPVDEGALGGEDAPERVLIATEKMVRGLAFAPRLQVDVRRDLLDHLLDAARAPHDSGPIDDDAIRAALRDFGDPWRIRTDLRRTAEGRRTVLFPRGVGETLAGLAIYDATILLAIIGAIVFVRLQMLTAYHIPTRSMEPTLHGDRRDGDRILVNRLSGPPERFDPFVFDGWGAERKNYVKRCVGLPNETILLREGDVYVNGDLLRKEGDVYEALLFRLYHWDDVWERALRDNPESREEAHEQVFDEQMDLWENIAGRWELHTGEGYHAAKPAADDEAVLRWEDVVRDDLYDAETGDFESGVHTCPDVRLAADVTLTSDATRVALRLTRATADYDARIEPGRVAVVVDGAEVAQAALPEITVGTPVRVLFSQVDRVLRLEVGETRLRHDLPQPSFPKQHSQVDSIIEFRVQGDAAVVKPVSLERDVYYTPESGADENGELGPNDYFMLGDNSGNSQDSRRNGAVHRKRLVGKPILIVWPPSRWRDPSTSPFPAPR